MKVHKIVEILKDPEHKLNAKLKDIEDLWDSIEDEDELFESIEIFTKHKHFK